MKKRVVAGMLTMAMVASMVAGCGSSSESASDNSSQTGTTEAASTADASGDVYEVVMEYPTLGSTPADLQKVEDAINERTESEIGVHVTLYPVSAFDLNSTTNLMVSSGEKLDLALSLFEGGCMSYVNKGIAMDLTDLVDQYGQDIVSAEGVAMSGGYYNGTLYAVPSEEKMGRVKAFVCRKDILDKYGIEYDENHIYTMDELSDIFATVQAGEDNGFYCIAAMPSDDAMWTFFDGVDFCGASLASGGVADFGNGTTVENYYATDEFADICKTTRSWYENGYFSPDCNTATDSDLTMLESGNYFGMFENAEIDMVANQSSAMQSYVGTDLVPLYTCEAASMTQYYQISQWMIPVTCENPEKTMQWLNMLYADTEMTNLIFYGIEGVHWQFTDGSDCVIEYPEGIDESNTPYPGLLGVFGDKSKKYVMAPLTEDYYQELADFNNSIDDAHTSKVLGYCFNTDKVSTQYAALCDVVTQYATSLSLGVSDPDTTIPEFLSALDAAGINEVIAENQSQLDAWLAEQ